ncbi:MAG: hypothetical protein K8R48_08075 [Alphaproteobacteria bacterium]|nr:hypothetical protein [Alphaproteobacteria bacterium]
MIGFLKSFFAGENSPEEQALLAAQELQKQRDVIVLDVYAMEDEEEQSSGGCGSGCGGCGCR